MIQFTYASNFTPPSEYWSLISHLKLCMLFPILRHGATNYNSNPSQMDVC